MAVAIVLLEKKLREYVNYLSKVTKETTVKLWNCDAIDSNQSQEACRGLQESSIILNKMVSRIKDIQHDISELPEKVLDSPGELFEVIELATKAEIEAELVISRVEVKLLHLAEVQKLKTLKSEKRVLPENTLEFQLNTIDNVPSSSADQVSPSLPVDGTTVPFQADQESKDTPRNGFELRRFCDAPDYVFSEFWKDFKETVDASPIDFNYKFAALRGLVRGDPYRLFLDLDYRSEEGYHRALKRLFDEYADDELKQRTLRESSRVLSNVENQQNLSADGIRSKVWSDDYFTRKYWNSVPNYEKPSRELLIKAMHAFLNLYVFGADKTSNGNWKYVWLILLHGVKFEDRYMLDVKEFGSEKISFPNLEESSEKSLVKFAPCFIKKKENHESKPKIWEWKYSTVEDGNVVEETVTTEKVKSWYRSCWAAVETDKEEEFQDYVKYFALLSMILFRVTIKKPAAVENYVGIMFNKTFRAFCSTLFMPNAVPPHDTVYRLVRKDIFKRSSGNFKTYLTYLVGSYAFSRRGRDGAQIRNFLNAGCLQVLGNVGTGGIYWLRKAAERKNMKPHELLSLFLIDPSMHAHTKRVREFIEMYQSEITWWWARLFEKSKLSEISTATCPAFAYACFVIQAANEDEIRNGRKYEQFSRFLKDGDSPSVTGENLGKALKYMIHEWSTTPLSQLTKTLHKKIELQKCVDKRKRFIGVD